MTWRTADSSLKTVGGGPPPSRAEGGALELQSAPGETLFQGEGAVRPPEPSRICHRTGSGGRLKKVHWRKENATTG